MTTEDVLSFYIAVGMVIVLTIALFLGVNKIVEYFEEIKFNHRNK